MYKQTKNNKEIQLFLRWNGITNTEPNQKRKKFNYKSSQI